MLPSPPCPAYATESRWVLTPSGRRIATAIAVPPDAAPGTAPRPWAVVCHGLGAKGRTGESTDAIARGLLAHGAAVVTFDMLGHGDSEGQLRDATFSSGCEDLLAVVRAVRAEQGEGVAAKLDLARLALVGTSYGGGVAILGAAALPEVDAVALRCPLTDPVPLERNLPRHHPFGKLFADSRQHDVLAAAAGLGMPAVIVHGTADQTIPIGDSRRLAAFWGTATGETPTCTLHAIDGANHQFARAAHARQSVDAAIEWLVTSPWGRSLTATPSAPSAARTIG